MKLQSTVKKNDPSNFYENAYQKVVEWLQENLGLSAFALEKSIILQCMKSLI